MSISLESSVRGCKVNTAYADKMQSARFQDPNLLVCPMWKGRNSKGQKVCPDSFMTKSAGCNSAEDRVMVENDLRPRYAEYISLNAAGIELGYEGTNLHQRESDYVSADLANTLNYTGQFGYGSGNPAVSPSCGLSAYSETYPTVSREGFAQQSQQSREGQILKHGYTAQQSRSCSGF